MNGNGPRSQLFLSESVYNVSNTIMIFLLAENMQMLSGVYSGSNTKNKP